jgi:hypothetical protein
VILRPRIPGEVPAGAVGVHIVEERLGLPVPLGVRVAPVNDAGAEVDSQVPDLEEERLAAPAEVDRPDLTLVAQREGRAELAGLPVHVGLEHLAWLVDPGVGIGLEKLPSHDVGQGGLQLGEQEHEQLIAVDRIGPRALGVVVEHAMADPHGLVARLVAGHCLAAGGALGRQVAPEPVRD